MRCNPPSLRPLVFNLYQAQLTHLPTIGGGGGGNAKNPPDGRTRHSTRSRILVTPRRFRYSALGPGPARRAVSRTGGRAGAEHLHANTDGERRAGRERALHHHDRLRGHRGCRGGGRLPAPPLQPGARNDRRPEPRGQGHVPPEQRREQQRQTHDSARRRVHRHRRRGHEDTAG